MQTGAPGSGRPKKDPEFTLEQFLPYRLSLLSNTISQAIAENYRSAHGLSVTEWRCLAILGGHPGLTAGEVASRGAMDKVAVSRAVAGLLERGLLERSAQADDRRRHHLRLTAPKGQALYRAVVPKALRYEQRLLAGFSNEELQRLDALLQRLQTAAASLHPAD